MSAAANLLDAHARLIHAQAVFSRLLSLPHWDKERQQGLDQAGSDVTIAQRNLEAWKRATYER